MRLMTARLWRRLVLLAGRNCTAMYGFKGNSKPILRLFAVG
jgi:hypothetical protein